MDLQERYLHAARLGILRAAWLEARHASVSDAVAKSCSSRFATRTPRPWTWPTRGWPFSWPGPGGDPC